MVNRLVDSRGVVDFLQLPNPPWHNGGVPFVVADDPAYSGYWHFYDLETL